MLTKPTADQAGPVFEWAADWHHAEHRDDIMFTELCNMLDIMLYRGANHLAYAAAMETGMDPKDGEPHTQLGAAIASFTGC